MLGCAGMADLNARLAAEFGLPVIDGVAAAVKLVEAVVGLGPRHQQGRAAMRAPLAKRYAARWGGSRRREVVPWTGSERPSRASTSTVPHYRRFGSELAAAMRREIYGEDLGQTGWRSAAEQVADRELLGLGPGSRLLDIGCGSGGPSLALAERTGCARDRARHRGGRASPMPSRWPRQRGLADRADFQVARLRRPPPVCRRRLRRGPVRRCRSITCRTAQARSVEWARLLRPGGRLLFTDALVVTGPISKPEIDAPVQPGLLPVRATGRERGRDRRRRPDAAAGERPHAGRPPRSPHGWHDVARPPCRRSWTPQEGAAWFEQRQRFLATTAELAASRPDVALPLSCRKAAA